MAEHATVIDVSRYYPTGGKRDELVEAMRRLASAASNAQGCFGAQVCESDHYPEAVVALSRWESAGALDAFANSGDFVHERDGLTSLLARPAEHEHYRSI